MHVGGKPPYKFLSLRTSDKATAIEKALDHWRNLKNHIESGGSVFEKKTSEVIDAYLQHLDELVETEQLKKHTVQCKRTGFKKLKEYLSAYEKLSDIPSDIFKDYTKWRRTKNWTKYHKNNTKPPSDLTVNKELTDFKGFFDWCSKERIRTNDFEFPWLKIDSRKRKESSPPFTKKDIDIIQEFLPKWALDRDLAENRKNNFYRKVFTFYFMILAQSGMRPHECLKLKWNDVEIFSEFEKIQLTGDADVDRKLLPQFPYITKHTGESFTAAKKLGRDWFEFEFLGAKIEVDIDTKTGRRIIYCPAGHEFKTLWWTYKKFAPIKPTRNDYVFQNVGTSHSKGDKHLGNPLNDTFLRRLWYEFRDYLNSKGFELNPAYTLYSCRSFYINQNLEAGNKPHQVAKMVGHSVSTQSKHYEAMEVKKLASRFSRLTQGQIEDSKLKTKFADEV